MQQEHSAGVVILTKKNACWHVLFIRDMKGMLTFPKGLIEEGEKPQETAVREAREETGITNLTLHTELPSVSYFYTRHGVSIKKSVRYFLCTTDNPGVLSPQQEEGISEVLWVALENADTVVGYNASNGPVLHAATDWVRQHAKYLV